ncbi:beta-galactosidase B [Aureobasidium sp. EXF-3400]|nr:beta-galactosidase B [Aureobasidium sp. EXF-12344]KAI4784927.1 beta-galactosidase B [Aureobasidium sp. EXF-3400]
MKGLFKSLTLSLPLGLAALSSAQETQWPLRSNGLTDLVEWDHYSFKVNGERLFIWSGEMHYWRIPVPELWVDVLHKVKAAGFNAVSFYSHWGFHAPRDGVVDFESGAHNISSLFETCKQLGLYIFYRPGPYINAESTGGGFPGWVTTGAYGSLRNNDTRYTEAWKPYIETVNGIIAEHSIVNGGNVIFYQVENEYGYQWTNTARRTPNETAIHYMELLETVANDTGINMPTVHNNPNLGSKSWSMDYDINKVGGDTNVYAVDNYPSCWSCNLQECASTNSPAPDFTVLDYHTHFQETAPGDPSFFAEFQGGSYNPWDGPAGGCRNNTGPDWVNVFYRNNVAQKVTAHNMYMLYGGTNWGALAFPLVGTSYDYSAPIQEDRLIGDKYSEAKLLGYFIRSAKDLPLVERGTNGTNLTTNSNVFTQVLYNVENNAQFYVVRHANTTLQTSLSFKQNMTTSLGNFQVPQHAADIRINGRESKILVSDYNAGDQKIIYSTAEVLAVSIQNGKPIIVFWVPTGESGEFYLTGAQHGSVKQCDGCSSVGFYQTKDGVITSFAQGSGMSVFQYGDGVTAIVVDRSQAYKLWHTTLTNDPHVPLDKTALVTGPYLVRTAVIEGETLALVGDYNGTTPLEVFAAGVKKVTFNGECVSVKDSAYGSLKGKLGQDKVTVQSLTASLPKLSQWKVADGLPEREADYDDSKWVNANHTTTPHWNKPATDHILYADEYGFHGGNILWRGRFNGTRSGIFLNVIGGTGSGWSAWLNGKFVGSTFGDIKLSQTNQTLKFGDAAKSGENVLFIIQDHMGKDQTTGAINPRGILNATLADGAKFTSWKIAGKAGGGANIDPVRGPYNEGGLHAERLGWHLPGFDDSKWASGSPSTGLNTAGAKFYRTVLPLDLPEGHDVSLAFNLQASKSSKLRAQLYVNGYQFGKYVPYIGNQVEFPVFPGILDYHGNNTIGLSIWSQDNVEASVSVGVSVLGVHSSGFDVGFNSSYLRPGWTKERLQYY